jgi:hypothetical protein
MISGSWLVTFALMVGARLFEGMFIILAIFLRGERDGHVRGEVYGSSVLV